MNILYYEECVKYALTQKQIICDTFEDANLRVYKRYDFNPQAIFSAVGKGGIIIPIIGTSFFGQDTDGLMYTHIVRVNRAKNIIELYNPIIMSCQEFPLDTFIESWGKDGSDCITAFPADAKTYYPNAIDCSDIQLPSEVTELCELLAEHAHDIWAIERQSEGWTYGPKRDDHNLQTPDMIPYSQLLETEKQYDRLMAMGTLKLIKKLGYDIVKHKA